MTLLFVYWAFEDQGSGLVIQGYTEAARKLGHTVAVYGRWTLGAANPRIALDYSNDVRSADAVVFIFEWTTELKPGDQLDLVRLVGKIPRERRVVLDGDGKYNDLVRVAEDENHPDHASCRRWIDVCDGLTDKICQPTLHPLRPGVRPFLFHAYNPSWQRSLDLETKEYDLIYVGHSKFRWGAMSRVLRAVEPVRRDLGRVALVGHGWDSLPWWAVEMGLEQSYFSDSQYLRKLDVTVVPPIRFGRVIDWMSKGVVNPVLLRPTFDRLRLVTPRLFETPAASTLPLFVFDREHVAEIYGRAGLELVLPSERADEKLLDMLERRAHYAAVASDVRRHLAEHHSYAARLAELVEIVES